MRTHRSSRRATSLLVGFCALAAVLPARWAHAEDKTVFDKLVNKIPPDIKRIGTLIKQISGLYSDVKGGVDMVIAVAKMLGLIEGEDLAGQLAALQKQVDDVGATLSWQMAESTRAHQRSVLHSAVIVSNDVVSRGQVLDTMHGPFFDSAVAVNEASSANAFLRFKRDDPKDDEWKRVLGAAGNVETVRDDTGALRLVPDWRVGVPHLLGLITQQLVVLAGADKNFLTNHRFDKILDDNIAVLRSQYNTMSRGLVCGFAQSPTHSGSPIDGCDLLPDFRTYVCADKYSGTFAKAYHMPTCTSFTCGVETGCTYDQQKATLLEDELRGQVFMRTGIFEVKAMLDLLQILRSGAPDLTETSQIVRAPAAPSALCLTGDSNPVTLARCNEVPEQQWSYDRKAGLIRNRSSDQCLGVAGAGLRRGTPVNIQPCEETLAVQWTYDASERVLYSGLGQVLDVVGGVLQAGVAVQAWPLTRQAGQSWSSF